jgi:sphingolipid delta-4 desaturase
MAAAAVHSKGEMAKVKGTRDYYWSQEEEPHKIRRKQMMEKYGPQIQALEGYDPKTKWVVLAMMATQFTVAYYMQTANWVLWFICAYAIGGVINHALTLAIHECAHNLLFKKTEWNQIFGIIANTPMGIPSAITFKRYHLEHHAQQGVEGVDMDIPSQAEINFFTSAPRKFLWLILQPFFYGLRPLLLNPKAPGPWEICNTTVALAFDFAVYYFVGGKALAYLVCSTLLGMGVHPVAGHFVSEHYVFTKGFETYSYYGPLNWVTFNVGYHNEHHDFPRIPGSRLYRLREIAPEFYDCLPHHTSWVKVLWDYVMLDHIGPHSRTMRTAEVMQGKGKRAPKAE